MQIKAHFINYNPGNSKSAYAKKFYYWNLDEKIIDKYKELYTGIPVKAIVDNQNKREFVMIDGIIDLPQDPKLKSVFKLFGEHKNKKIST